jgi:signal transduction histidine kinase
MIAATPKSLARARNFTRPSLRVQLTLLYSGLLLAVLAAALLATNLIYGHTAAVSRGGRPAAPGPATGPVAGSSHFDIGPALIGLAAAAIALAGAWWLAGRFLRPLKEMTTTAQEISATDLDRRLDLRGPNDELTALGHTLDDLFGRLGTSFESQRHFVANASHELLTPLAGLQTLLEVAVADPEADADALRAACQKALSLGQHQERLVTALLALATSERGVETWGQLDLAQITETVVTGRTHDADTQDIDLKTNIAAAPATGDPQLVELLVTNLIENAIRHNHPGGQVEISVSTTDARAILSVSNTGPTIPSDQVARLLQPFQRLGKERIGINDGHGLGLAIVSAIAAAHAARLSVRPGSDGGLNIEVSFPAAHTPAAITS